MKSTAAALAKEADCPTGELEQADLDESEKETSVRKLKAQRTASPSIVINRNGSRYISPLDIVRSEVGRAEILRQRTHRNGAANPVREGENKDKDEDKGSNRKDR